MKDAKLQMILSADSGYQSMRNYRIDKRQWSEIQGVLNSSPLRVKVKRLHEDAVIPKYAKQGDAGMDLTAIKAERLDNEHIKYSFGLAFEIPDNHVGLIFPRSSCYKQRQLLSNAVGVVDSGYRGEVSAVMLGTSNLYSYRVGDRVAQMVVLPYPSVELIESDNLTTTERGDGGYGSTGR